MTSDDHPVQTAGPTTVDEPRTSIGWSWVVSAWHYRAPAATAIGIGLAVLAEASVRSDSERSAGAGAGLQLLILAVLLVGLGSWSLRQPVLTLPAVRTIPPRRARSLMSAARALPGWMLPGVPAVGVCAIWWFVLLSRDLADPIAPRVWLAMLAVMVVAVAGYGPWPAGPVLVGDHAHVQRLRRAVGGEWLLLGLLLLTAAVVRLWHLDTIPTGPYSDEADRVIDARHLNRGEPVNQSAFLLFGTGWWGVPSLYFWLVAQSLRLFGDSLAGARTVHALAGIATVWFTYQLVRSAWTHRAALVAGALLAVSDLAIQFSRTAGESTITILTWTACMYYLYRAIMRRRPLDWVLAGIGAGFTLYGYASGKLLPPALLLVGIYLVVRWGKRGALLYAPGLGLLAVSATLTWGPNALYVWLHPDAFTMRSNSVSIFSPQNSPAVWTMYHTHNWLSVLWQQFAVTFRVFDVGVEHGPFYPTGEAILPVLWAALWVLGCAVVVLRSADVRYAILAIWVVAGVAGAALTTDAPTVQRVAGMVPTLAIIPAVFVDEVLERLTSVARFGAMRHLSHIGTGALVALLGAQTLSFYFGEYTPQHLYWDLSVAGRYAQRLNPVSDTVYQMNDILPWWFGPTLLYAGRVHGQDLINPSDELPVTDSRGRNVHFLVFPNESEYLPVLRVYYPRGNQIVVHDPAGHVAMTAYRASADAVRALHSAAAIYRRGGQVVLRRFEPGLGTAAHGAGLPVRTFPLEARWESRLLVPTTRTYHLRLQTDEPALLQIDGRDVLGLHGRGGLVESRVRLVHGPHNIRLQGRLERATDAVSLWWGTRSGALHPVNRNLLWNGPGGWFLVQEYSRAGPSFLRGGPAPSSPVTERRVGLLGWRAYSSPAGLQQAAVRCTGRIRITKPGRYGFDLRTDEPASLLLDGHLAASSPASGQFRVIHVTKRLQAGTHRVDVRVLMNHAMFPLELLWRPPAGVSAVVSPTALAAIDGDPR